MTATATAPRRLDDVPGPKGWPVLGNALEIRPGIFHHQLEAWARQYGDAFVFRIASRRYLAVTDPAVIASVLRRRPDVFHRTQRLEQIATDLGFVGVFSANGDVWRRQRPMVLSGLDPAHIKTFLPALVDVTQRLQRRWERAAANGSQLDLLAELMRYTVDVTTGLAFGKNLNTLEAESVDTIQQHLNVIFPVLLRRLLAPVDVRHWVKDRALEVHLQALKVAVVGFIAAARAELDADPQLRERPRNLIQALLAARDRPDSGVTDEDVSGNVFTMLLAGEDTTASTLAWMVWLLFRNPAEAAVVRAEVDAVLAGDHQVRSFEQLARLDAIQACAYETMRLKPVAPLIINEAMEDAVVGDVLVPRGSYVMCVMRPAAIDAAVVEQAQSFRPGRWAAASPDAAGLKHACMPFGAGPRMCPGRYLALAEIKMAAAMLFSRFELEDVSVAGGGEPGERFTFVMAPENLQVRLRLRQPSTGATVHPAAAAAVQDVAALA
jgi:cytochrome P450